MMITPQRQARSRRLGRIPFLAVAVTTALVVTGCASNSATSSGTKNTVGPSVTAAVDANAVTDYLAYTGGKAGKADSTKSPVTIGWVNQQGGALGFPTATEGAQAAVNYVNTHLGGIGGHPLALNTCYIAENEQEGNACGLQLVNDKNVKSVLYGTVIAGNQSFQR